MRSNTLMLGYWNNSVATAEALRDGWYHTGDIGTMDEEGYIFLVDRKKDMIISGGENVYCREVELIEFAATRIARYKRPKSIEFVDELPRLPSGKVSKVILRQHYRN